MFGLAFCISRRTLSSKTSTGIVIEDMETNGDQSTGLGGLITDCVKSIGEYFIRKKSFSSCNFLERFYAKVTINN